ncbi:MAG: flavin reductase [Clostridiales bacterium]|nr:flavin reductase [Clostridiales bacterium]
MKLPKDIVYVGVNDHQIDLFEGQYVVQNGMSYNSYIVFDEKIAVFDTVDRNFTHQWLDNLEAALEGKMPDYLIVSHMEPDHSSNLLAFAKNYPKTKIVSSDKSFVMMRNFFGDSFEGRQIVVDDGDTLCLGAHTLTFVTAPMVHWPEVIMAYDDVTKSFFSADAFGKFGALDHDDEDWAGEARRYYFGVVGKYGAQVQKLFKKIEDFEIENICPLHGPMLIGNTDYYLDLYNIWSTYGVESDGIVIAYTSVYGNTKKAVEILAEKLRAKGCPDVVVNDLARCDMAGAVEDAFRYGRIVLATTTYNADIFPFMREFIDHITERGFKNRTVAMIENGSWAPQAVRIMKNMLDSCQGITYADTSVRINSALNEIGLQQLEDLATELCRDYIARNDETADKNNLDALFNIGYGLYVVTSNDGKKDNGLIVNTISQITNTPNRIAVCINKQNYSHHVIKQTGIMNVNCLSTDAPFRVFEDFGFRSGRNADKFKNYDYLRSDNGLTFLTKYINSFISLKVEQYIDLDTHGMFICSVTEARVLSDKETMTYTFYQNNVKPKPDTEGLKGWVCKICGYIYDGDELPDDFVCPLCKHGKADFVRIGDG